jgi:selenocysteine lyase/cysteine desulfurase
MEHNAVVRPLDRLRAERGIRFEIMPADPLGFVDWDAAKLKAAGGPPKLVAVCHGSNVNGVVQDLEAARKAFPGAALFVDAAQTAGVLPIHVEEQGIDFLACSAHKGLLGPTGVGLCYLNPDHDVSPLMEGGTGSNSEHTIQPTVRPDRYESGTLNLHGAAGLLGALEHLEAEGLSGGHKLLLTNRLLAGVKDHPRVNIHSPMDGSALLPALTVEGVRTDQVALRLEREYGILCRPGLHCAPMAHEHLGTFPEGTVRLAPGWGNTEEDISVAVEALLAISGEA